MDDVPKFDVVEQHRLQVDGGDVDRPEVEDAGLTLHGDLQPAKPLQLQRIFSLSWKFRDSTDCEHQFPLSLGVYNQQSQLNWKPNSRPPAVG